MVKLTFSIKKKKMHCCIFPLLEVSRKCRGESVFLHHVRWHALSTETWSVILQSEWTLCNVWRKFTRWSNEFMKVRQMGNPHRQKKNIDPLLIWAHGQSCSVCVSKDERKINEKAKRERFSLPGRSFGNLHQWGWWRWRRWSRCCSGQSPSHYFLQTKPEPSICRHEVVKYVDVNTMKTRHFMFGLCTMLFRFPGGWRNSFKTPRMSK